MQMIGGSDALMRGGKLDGGLQTTLRRLLFGTSNATGFTFEPWDITTLYQDRAGTTPVTAVGQSVGLRLSKDKGLALGPEVNPDPGFNTPGVWTFTGASPGWSISGGKAECTATAGGNRWILIPNRLTVGVTYLVTADVVVTAGRFVPDVSAVAATYATTSGTKKWIVTASTATLQFVAKSDFIGSIDNVSVKTLAGNHEVAINDAARGVYGREPEGGTRNRLTYTEQFDNAAWAKNNMSITPNTAVAPDGTTTADTYTPASGTVSPDVNQNVTVLSGTNYVYSFYLKDTGNGSGWWEITTINPTVRSWFDIRNGVKGNGAGSITSVGNGWYRCSVPTTTTSTATVLYLSPRSANGNAAAITATAVPYAFVWGAQLELGASATAYQKVVSQYDVTEAGVASCYYVQTDGFDDAYVTPTITPGTDKVQVFAGVRKNSDAASGIFVELSTEYTTNPGAFVLAAPSSAGANSYRFGSNGSPTAPGANAGTGVFAAAPNTSVLTGLGDISGDIATLRRNGALVQTSTTDQGTGNYLAYPAYIYARGGAGLPFNGRDYGHAVRFGPTLDAATIARVEALIARNTPTVTL